MRIRCFLSAGMLALAALAGQAQNTIYVAVTGTHDAANGFNTPAGAATNLHAAVAVAAPGDTVLVGPGLFYVSNQIVMGTGYTVQGAGPSTIIARNGAANYRIFAVSNATAVLSSVTVSNGVAPGNGGGVQLVSGLVTNCVIVRNRGQYSSSNGGGVSVAGGLLVDCLIRDCQAQSGGAGIYITNGLALRCTVRDSGLLGPSTAGAIRMTGGAVRQCTVVSNVCSGTAGIHMIGGLAENCLVVSNAATGADGAGGVALAGGVLLHCTVADNLGSAASMAGGIYRTAGAATNCIVWNNYRWLAPHDYSGLESAIRYSCGRGLAVANGNTADDPRFANPALGNYRLAAGSACRDRAVSISGTTADLDLASRPVDGDGDGAAAPDMGAYEAAAMAPGELAAWVTTPDPRTGFSPLPVTFEALLSGDNTSAAWYGWDFNGDGMWEAAGAGLGSFATNLPTGVYSVTLLVTNSAGTAARVTVTNMVAALETNLYVSAGGSSVPPYASLATAATNLADALVLAISNCQVNVDAGLYPLTGTFRITIPLAIRGIGAPAATVIARTGAAFYRPFWLAHAGAVLSSVTVSNGIDSPGGGILLEAGLVTNCVITRCRGSSSGTQGGGAQISGGLMVDTVVNDCYSPAGGGGLWLTGGEALRCVIRNGGPYAATTSKGAVLVAGGSLRQCVVISNRTTVASGTAGIQLDSGLVENCLVASNLATAATGVGGVTVTGGRLIHATVADNACAANGTAGGINATGGAVTNTIIWGNLKGGAASDFPGGDSRARHSCASDLAVANGNKNSNPNFDLTGDGQYRLASGSPCIDAGADVPGIPVDLLGTNRVIDGNGDSLAAADMGACEAPEIGNVFVAGIETDSLTTGFAPLEVVLRAAVAGNNTNLKWVAWDLDGDGAVDRAGANLAVVTNTFGLGRFTIRLWVTNTSDVGASAVQSNLVNVLARDIYVSQGGSGAYPYDTLAKATTNLEEALFMAIGDCVVNVDAGVYGMKQSYQFYTNITVRGLAGPADTVIWRATDDTDRFRPFQLAHDGALLASVTVSNGYATDTGGGVLLTAGVVSNCIIIRCKAPHTSSSGGGMQMTGGRVEDTLFRDCYAYRGGAIAMTGGEAIRCTIRDGGVYGVTPGGGSVMLSGGALRQSVVASNRCGQVGGVSMTGGLLENSLIASNEATLAGGVGGLVMSGSVVNCTIAGNRCATNGLAGGANLVFGGLTNSIVAGNVMGTTPSDATGSLALAFFSCAPELAPGVQGNLAADPAFRNPAGEDYRLGAGSPCRNAGTLYAGMPPLDLAGQPRVRQGVPDMGAYELLPPPGTLLFLK